MCRVDSGSDFVGDVDALRPGSLRTAEALMTRRRILAGAISERAEFPGWGSIAGFDAGVRHRSGSCKCGGHKKESREEGGELHF